MSILKDKIDYYGLTEKDLQKIDETQGIENFKLGWNEFLFSREDIDGEFSQMFLDGSFTDEEEKEAENWTIEQKSNRILQSGYLIDLECGTTMFLWKFNKPTKEEVKHG